ncbi:MAG: UDP-N-acetylenolpyruvoylglucosamine reductase [Chroococcopsis gigantea SAG 12.99]|jgi:UDP-N-acetylmuramate dehydrogenase|nr:UDP-N-acetylenolpyruvoylglucosamine reductase [Chroococcopsis gigantea SAG 12.99]
MTLDTVKYQVPLADHTSYRVGGMAEWFAQPCDLNQLQELFLWWQTEGGPLTLLGAGSNLLISDRGLPGLVVSTRYLRHTSFDNDSAHITAAAGEPLPKLAWRAAKRGWQGLEWAVGIPGTVGGAVVMNAGAHKGCIADCLVSATVLNPDGGLETLTAQQLGYSYRTSALQGAGRLVISATFALNPGFDTQKMMALTGHNLHHRKNTQPYDKPSCGSVFRNPEPYAAGWLIEQEGLKGYRIGEAEVSQRHANFILNRGQAKAQDIFRLIRHVQAEVSGAWSVLLEPEVRILGDFSGVCF